MPDLPIDKSFISKHRVIEASAGTGKTYTLVELVIWLLESGAGIEEFLIVTFTEKAAGEIKARIRKGLKERFEKYKDENKVVTESKTLLLETALDNIDSISVNTIHGFCQKTLSQYAFENRLAGENRLVSDKSIYASLLKTVQRKHWPEWMGDVFEIGLYFSGFPDSGRGESRFEKTILDLCANWNPLSGDRLLPETLVSWLELKKTIAHSETLLKEAKDRVRVFLRDLGNMEAFYKGFSDMNADGKKLNRKKAIECFFKPLFDWSEAKESKYLLTDFYERCFLKWKGYPKRLDDPETPLVMPGPDEIKKAGKGVSDHEKHCPKLPVISEIIEMCRAPVALIERQLSLRLKYDSVIKVRKLAAEFKIRNGLQSYQDMINNVWIALESGGEGSPILKVLRSRYKYALVDEFQDTDELQWKIFRKIFLEEKPLSLGSETKRRLVVIGDPKQSIYRFRGADVHTYEKAKAQISGGNQKDIKHLSRNWRADKGVVEGLNRLFIKGNWFDNEQLSNTLKVDVPDKNPRVGFTHDNSRRRALTFVKPAAENSSSVQARIQLSHFTAREIKALTTDRSFQIRDSEGYRNLNENDICILINKRSEFAFLKMALEKQGIAYSFYKQTGIWQSDEAVHLNYLFKYFSDPGDKNHLKFALLTDYFRLSPDDISALALDAYNNNIMESLALLETWSEIAAEKKWPLLFRNIFTRNKYFMSGSKADLFERRVSNFYQLTQSLELAASARNMDVYALSEYLSGRCSEKIEEAEQEYHRLETEDPKVRIMTMHASKGLEFPVVFVMGGFTKAHDFRDYYHFHDGENVCYDLEKHPDYKTPHDGEIKAEEARLLYVAFTRAQYKLYLPHFSAKGSYGPAATLLHKAIETAWPEGSGDENAAFVNTDDNARDSGGYVSKVNSEKAPFNITEEELEKLYPAPPEQLWDRKRDLTSFSSLKKKEEQKSSASVYVNLPGTEFVEGTEKETDEPELPEAEENTAEPYSVLPKGEPTGSMIHEVFENIDFEKVGQAKTYGDLLENKDTADVIDTALRKWGLYTSKSDESFAYRVPAAKLVFHALNSPLDTEGFKLSSLKSEDKLHELEFFYPYLHSNNVINGVIPDISETPDGYLMGYMDLVFRKEGKYYLLDWKSNTLDEGYGPASLKASMEEARYDLQYQIYILGLFNWMRRHGLDPRQSFGGVYYLYLRGMDGTARRPGVFFTNKITAADCEKGFMGAV